MLLVIDVGNTETKLGFFERRLRRRRELTDVARHDGAAAHR